MLVRGLVIGLFVLLAGCSTAPEELPEKASEKVAETGPSCTYRNFRIERISFGVDRNKALFVDLSNWSKNHFIDVDPIFMIKRVGETWRDDELARVADETIEKTKLFKDSPTGTSEHPGPGVISIEIAGQEYVTDGVWRRPTVYYSLRVNVVVRRKGPDAREEVLKGAAVARRYFSWGTPSYSPMSGSEVYSVFSDALSHALVKAMHKDAVDEEVLK